MTVEMFKEFLMERTEEATLIFERESRVTGKAKVQKLFDMSTFDCNKPIIAELFKQLGNNNMEFVDLETEAERRLNILYPVGTVVSIARKHDWHTYNVGDYAVITGHRPLTKGKVVMETLNVQTMDKGSNLYHYSLWEYLAFIPAEVIDYVVNEKFAKEWNTINVKRWVNVIIGGSNE